MPLAIPSESEAKASSRSLLEKGVYPFTVHAAAETISKTSGNPQIHLKLHVHRPTGGVQFVDDYLVAKLAWKLRHFAATCNLGCAGEINADALSGAQGYAQIDIEGERPKNDGSGNWPAKNVVKDYGQPAGGGNRIAFISPSESRRPEPTPAQAANQTGAASTEDVPFAALREFAQ